MIKVGDIVKHKYGVLAGNTGKVLKDLGFDLFEVVFDHKPSFNFHCAGSELELAELPIGNQSKIVPEWYPEVEELSKPKCDCGGFKVYGSMEHVAHSAWCSIFGVK